MYTAAYVPFYKIQTANDGADQLPWNTQNHKFLAEEQGFHQATYFPASSPDDILASRRNRTQTCLINFQDLHI